MLGSEEKRRGVPIRPRKRRTIALTNARIWRSDQRKSGPSDKRSTQGEVPRRSSEIRRAEPTLPKTPSPASPSRLSGTYSATRHEKEVSICRRIPPYEHILHLKEDVRKKDSYDVVFESHDPTADLSRKIRRGGLRRDTVRDFSRQILLGLAHCHRNMVIQRYLNPTKILQTS